MGDSFLPIKGQRIFEFFERIRPFLDGVWTLSELLCSMNKIQRRTAVSMLRALRNAGMLYDGAHDPAAVLSDGIRTQYAPTIRRLEAVSDSPHQAFSILRNTRLALAGNASAVAALAEAALEAGFCKIMLSVPSWSAESLARLELLVLKRTTLNSAVSISRIPWIRDNAWQNMSVSIDTLILAGDSEVDSNWIAEIETECSGIDAPWVPLLLHAGHILAGPPVRGEVKAWMHDLLQGYRIEADGPRTTKMDAAAAFSAGAALVIDILLQLLSGVTDPDAIPMYDFDLETLEICRRPPPIGARGTRDHNCHSSDSGSKNSMAGIGGACPSFDPDGFLAAARTRFIDDRTGLLLEVDEGALYQLPHHQTAALWRIPGTDRLRRTTEAGVTIRESRIAVIRSALEEYLSAAPCQYFQSPPSSPMSIGNSGDVTNLAVAVSDLNWKTLHSQSALRLLSKLGLQVGDWSNVELNIEPEASEVYLTFAYLREVDAVSQIRVMRNDFLSSAEGEVLSFSYEDQLISIVAGTSRAALWETGLRDIWLHLTYREAFPQETDHLPAIRFRSPASDMAGADGWSLNVFARLNRVLRVHPLRGSYARLFGQLEFGWATLENGR